jgi:uncharacterized protein (TIGR02646 family)
MIYIDLENNPPPNEWITKATKLTQKLIAEPDLQEKKKLIDSNSTVWGEIKTHLLSLSHQKCWYSEAKEKFSYYHVEHFRPKKRALDNNGSDMGGYWWLAFCWKNYRICGAVGNTKKGDRFFVRANKANTYTDNIDDEIIYFLDPTAIDDPLKISFIDTGEVIPSSPNSTDWDYIRADYTIANLDLNHEPLVEGRKSLWATIVLRIREVQNLIDKNNLNPSASNKALIGEKLKELKGLASPQSEFSATASACLCSSGLEWAWRIVSKI